METRMRPVLACLVLLQACTEVQTYGAAAIERRRILNDMQARATMAATCDIALGAYFRELSEQERNYAALVCGGMAAAPTPTEARGVGEGTMRLRPLAQGRS